MHKRTLTKEQKFAIIIASVVVILVYLVLGWTESNKYCHTITSNWGITVPNTYKEVVSMDSGASFHGDGIRYHVFYYKKVPNFSEDLKWAFNEGETLSQKTYSEASEEWLDEILVPAEQRPNYEKVTYIYKSQSDGSELILMWDSAASRLYIVEFFM